MRKLALIICLFTMMVSACVPAAPIPTQTPYPTYTAQPTFTPYPTYTAIPTVTNTPEPTNTPIPPTPLPSPTANPTPGKVARNVHMVQEQNGVVVTLERLYISDPAARDGGLLEDPGFEGSKVYLQPLFTIKNNTDKEVAISDFQGTLVSANGEQVGEARFYNIFFRHPLEQSILPGSSIIGPVWVGMKQSAWNQVSKVVVKIPYFISDGKKVTDDFIFSIDVVEWDYEELPDHLK